MRTNSFKQFILIVIFLTLSGSAFGQEVLTAAQWQEDLRFLQKTVHADFPFLFKKVEKKVWDAEVENLYVEIPNLEEHEIRVGLSRIVSLFEYGHTQIPFSTIAKDGVLPINLYHFKDGIFVEGALKEHTKILAAKVIKVGEYPIDEALKMIRPVVPVENNSYFKAYGLRFLTVPAVLHAQGVIPDNGKNVSLTLEKEGKVITYELPSIAYNELSRDYNLTLPNELWVSARGAGEPPFYLKHLFEKYYHYEYLSDSKTLYVRQSSVFNHETESLAEFYKRLFDFIDTNDVQKLIYDVRLNGGGNNYNNKPLIQGIMARPELNKKGKFIYIIGRQTFSACQNLTNEIENYTNAIMVGEPTAENKNFYGDTKKTTLPNSKLNAYLSFAWWQDKAPWENADATTPQVFIEPTFAEYSTNQDPVLEMAMNYDFDSFLVNPMDHFTKLFIAGKMEQLKTDATRIVKDPVYAHIPFDKEFKQVGRNLLFQEQFEGAVFLYGMFSEYYPKDPEMWEGLGKAFKGMGKDKEADGAFAKAKTLSEKK
ncbi:hypothetical protein ACEZ3G_10505 [Maribacter algicola]|uniref:Uncharacterized protein n=1 Tax=Meishania litoralis TaxID=3434685 RepID=A0ACC7LK77_9FLAO